MMYAIPVAGFILPVTMKPNVTAGFKCPPEIWPVPVMLMPRINPCANATATRLASCWLIAIIPKKRECERTDRLRYQRGCQFHH